MAKPRIYFKPEASEAERSAVEARLENSTWDHGVNGTLVVDFYEPDDAEQRFAIYRAHRGLCNQCHTSWLTWSSRKDGREPSGSLCPRCDPDPAELPEQYLREFARELSKTEAFAELLLEWTKATDQLDPSTAEAVMVLADLLNTRGAERPLPLPDSKRLRLAIVRWAEEAKPSESELGLAQKAVASLRKAREKLERLGFSFAELL